MLREVQFGLKTGNSVIKQILPALSAGGTTIGTMLMGFDHLRFSFSDPVPQYIRDGIPRRQIVEEVSQIYGIPAECVEEVVAAVPV
ncbi:hypothetical protein [Methanoculleus sp.]|jgi:hypothetical protein|uniref:hypothetical protein n=1 Tax=Methanoculleus sp. TaxID=90427 RepID=UPI001BD57DC7|nr:hypothetical protein [Methanoculleus sp.]